MKKTFLTDLLEEVEKEDKEEEPRKDEKSNKPDIDSATRDLSYVVEKDGKVVKDNIKILGDVIEILSKEIKDKNIVPIKWDNMDFSDGDTKFSIYVKNKDKKLPLNDIDKKDIDDGIF